MRTRFVVRASADPKRILPHLPEPPPPLTMRELQQAHAWYVIAPKCPLCDLPFIIDGECLCCDWHAPRRDDPQPPLAARELDDP